MHCLLEGGDWLPGVEPRQREQQRRRLGRGGSPGSGEAGTCPGGCWPQADLLSRRVYSQRYRAAWSRAGAAEGARRAVRQGFLRSPRAVGSFQPACFLAGHPLQMEAGLLERGPTVFLPPTAVAPRTSPFTLERTRPSGDSGILTSSIQVPFLMA